MYTFMRYNVQTPSTIQFYTLSNFKIRKERLPETLRKNGEDIILL